MKKQPNLFHAVGMSRILTYFFFFFFFFFGKFETSWFEQNSYSMKLLNHWFESEYQHVWEYGSTTTFISFYQPSSRGVWPGVHGTGGYNLTRFGSPEARLFPVGGALNSFSVRDVRRCSKTTTQVIMSHKLTSSPKLSIGPHSQSTPFSSTQPGADPAAGKGLGSKLLTGPRRSRGQRPLA